MALILLDFWLVFAKQKQLLSSTCASKEPSASQFSSQCVAIRPHLKGTFRLQAFKSCITNGGGKEVTPGRGQQDSCVKRTFLHLLKKYLSKGTFKQTFPKQFAALAADKSPAKAKPRPRFTERQKESAAELHQTHLLCLIGRARMLEMAASDPLLQVTVLVYECHNIPISVNPTF